MNFAEGFGADPPTIGRKPGGFAVSAAVGLAALAARAAGRLAPGPSRASQASDRVVQTLEVHNRL